jgi:hypothetical protein
MSNQVIWTLNFLGKHFLEKQSSVWRTLHRVRVTQTTAVLGSDSQLPSPVSIEDSVCVDSICGSKDTV